MKNKLQGNFQLSFHNFEESITPTIHHFLLYAIRVNWYCWILCVLYILDTLKISYIQLH